MDSLTKNRVLGHLATWVENHDQPDEPALAMADGVTLSPRQIYNEVLEQTQVGVFMLAMIEEGAQRMSIDEVLSEFARPWLVSATSTRQTILQRRTFPTGHHR